MSTYLESYCNITTDLQAVEPNLDGYDQKRRITGHHSIVANGSPADVYTYYGTGYIGMLYRDGAELGAAQATAGAVDGNVDGEWYYDAAGDYLKVASVADPDTSHEIEAGQDWVTVKTEAVGRASEMVRSLAGRPIMKRLGTGQQSETLREWEDIIVRSAATIAVADLIRPYDFDRAAQLASLAYNPEETGWLDMIRKGTIALWNEVTPEKQQGLVRKVGTHGASSTGTIADVQGTATVRWDAVKVKIITGGTFAAGSASTVTYSVWVGDSTGLKNTQVVTAAVITGAYQTLAHSLYIRFAPGVYTADDEWEVLCAGTEAEAGTGGVQSIQLSRF